jgi:hypothetical protein
MRTSEQLRWRNGKEAPAERLTLKSFVAQLLQREVTGAGKPIRYLIPPARPIQTAATTPRSSLINSRLV